MMDWIKTNVVIGFRIKSFELDYRQALKLSPSLGKNQWDIKVLELLFEKLKANGYFPKTSRLFRVNMPPNKMSILFWVQDGSFPPIDEGAMVEPEYINLKEV